MDGNKSDITPYKVWWWVSVIIALMGAMVLVTRKFGWFYDHPYLGWGILIGGVVSLLVAWVCKEISENSVHKHNIVSGRVKARPGEAPYPTEIGKNRSEPEEHTTWFAISQPAQAGVTTAHQPGAVAGMGGWLKNQEWLGKALWFIAGLICAVESGYLMLVMVGSDEMLKPLTGAILFGLASIVCFLICAGKLGTVLEAAFASYKTLMLLCLAILSMIYFGLYSREGAFIWHMWNWEWPHVGFLVSTVVAILAGLKLANLLGWAAEGVGTGLAWLHFGKLSYTLSLVVWLGWIIGGSLVVASVTKSPVFDRLIYADVAGEVFAIGNIALAFGVGFFLIFGAIALDYRRFKK